MLACFLIRLLDQLGYDEFDILGISWGGGLAQQVAFQHQLVAGLGWTSLPVLRFLRQPTLILAGSDDPIIPLVNARIMARLLPDATLHVYDDGHLGLVTQAHLLAPVVTDFLLS